MGGGAMEGMLGRSPGPIYSPRGSCFGTGPSGKGSEYVMAPRSFSCSLSEKEGEAPTYQAPSMTSHQGCPGKLSRTSGRKTQEGLALASVKHSMLARSVRLALQLMTRGRHL